MRDGSGVVGACADILSRSIEASGNRTRDGTTSGRHGFDICRRHIPRPTLNLNVLSTRSSRLVSSSYLYDDQTILRLLFRADVESSLNNVNTYSELISVCSIIERIQVLSSTKRMSRLSANLGNDVFCIQGRCKVLNRK